ncbi:MAG: hypothetical protein DRJ42_20345 [Deltaproteobacteria bacterium]|nr:MAG: hypothetical protein DRJ42_20345 [Deltaproteobacteria bacterium]
MLQRSAFFVWGLAVVALSGACMTDDSVELVISTGGLALDQTSLEVRITTGPCPAIEDVILGDPSRPVAADAYRESGPSAVSLPPVGVLEDREYAFIAVIRDGSCRPLRYGCVVTNPAYASTVTIATTDPRDVNLGTFCAPGAECNGSLCAAGSVFTQCAVEEVGSECRLPSGATGNCCDGVCAAGGTTPGDCSTTTPPCTDPAAPCSECAAGCREGTICHGVTCGPADAITVTVDSDTADLEGLHAGLAWRPVDISGSTGSVVAVSDGQPFEGSRDRIVVTLPDVPPREALAAGDATPGGVVVAEVVVAVDADGDGILELSEVTMTTAAGGLPSPYGISPDVGVVYLRESIDSSLAGAFGFTGEPPVGVHAYVRADSSGEPSFTHVSDPATLVTPCTQPAGSADQDTCIAALPSALPF